MVMSVEEMLEALQSAQEELDQLLATPGTPPGKIQAYQSVIGNYARELEIMGVDYPLRQVT